jgi:hypothetical protein
MLMGQLLGGVMRFLNLFFFVIFDFADQAGVPSDFKNEDHSSWVGDDWNRCGHWISAQSQEMRFLFERTSFFLRYGRY